MNNEKERVKRSKEELSKLSYSQLMENIREFEKKYGKDFSSFKSSLEEHKARSEELLDEFLWEQYVKEIKRRFQGGRLELTIEDAKELTEVFTATRLEVIAYLSRKGEGTVSEIAKAVGKPIGSVSEILKILESKGIISSHRKGRRKVYRLLVKEILLKL